MDDKPDIDANERIETEANAKQISVSQLITVRPKGTQGTQREVKTNPPPPGVPFGGGLWPKEAQTLFSPLKLVHKAPTARHPLRHPG